MNRTELTKLNVGYNLDWLMNLDPRGYGVCRILYDGAIKYTGKPLSLNGAEGLVQNIKKGEKVFILTGFVLLPWNEAETDGIISSTVFARFVMRAFGAKPVMIVPDQCEKSIKAMSVVLGVDMKANALTMKLNINAGRLFNEYGIRYQNKRCHDGRRVSLAFEQRDDS